VNRETGRKETRGGRKEKRGKREGRKVRLLDVCIIYFISCDCIMNNSSLSYPIY
jgi:hypothetical protein